MRSHEVRLSAEIESDGVDCRGGDRYALVSRSVWVTAIHAPTRGDDDAVERLVLVGVMRDSRIAGHHWRIVHAALHRVSVEITRPHHDCGWCIVSRKGTSSGVVAGALT